MAVAVLDSRSTKPSFSVGDLTVFGGDEVAAHIKITTNKNQLRAKQAKYISE